MKKFLSSSLGKIYQMASTKPIAVAAAKSRSFPEEFKKSWTASIDVRYSIILAISFIFVYSLFLFLAFTYKPDISAREERIKQQFMTKILGQSVQLDIEEKEQLDTDNDLIAQDQESQETPQEQASAKGKTQEELSSEEFQAARAEAAAAAREEYQANVQAQAQAALATLTGRSRTGRSSAGSAVDVLGGASGGADLSSILSQATGKGAESGLGLGTATRANVGRGAAGGRTLGQVGAGTGLGAGSGVGDALARGGSIKASLSTGKVRSTGSASRKVDELEQVIQSHSRAIQACYEAEKVKDPTLKGQIVIEFQIMKDGRVAGPKAVQNTLRNQNVERCIINKVRLWRFSEVTDPKPQTLRIPYSFSD